MLWRVGVRLLVAPVKLDLGIQWLRVGSAGQFNAHERVETIKEVAHHLHVLLRHRLLPQPDGFEGLRLA